ncbi:hypothetical protein FQN54_001855 [Arachnomyces sp. PD_36]|nr:hypothetical protein FQN54_001855 [Arachnomyces sp. PD_36]
MGYFEVNCQLCGVSFNISRIRTAEEPKSSAWGHGMRSRWVDGGNYYGCQPEDGCTVVFRGDPLTMPREPDLLDKYDDETDTSEDSWIEDEETVSSGSDDGEESDSSDSGGEEESNTPSSQPHDAVSEEIFMPITSAVDDFELNGSYEHIAGPGCKNTQGYNGHRISVDEMQGCHTVQCLLEKGGGWKPEVGDLNCELQGNQYITGLADRMPPGGSFIIFSPARHGTGVGHAQVEFEGTPATIQELPVIALPFHPTCFELFSQASRKLFGHVDIDTLVRIRNEVALGSTEFPVENSADVIRARQQVWVSEVGCEYLAANPIFIRELKYILASAVSNDEKFSVQASPFERGTTAKQLSVSNDPFLSFPREIVYGILSYLDSPAIAALRLSSRTFEHLPISLWRELVVNEMPWLYEAWSSDPEPYYWATIDASDMKKKMKAREKFQEKIEHDREVIEQEMPEIYDEWKDAEPEFEWPESVEQQKLSDLSPVKLPRYKTNWYKLYRDITLNWDKLKGLQNRKRIWGDIMQLMDVMEWFRDGHDLWFHKFYVNRRMPRQT